LILKNRFLALLAAVAAGSFLFSFPAAAEQGNDDCLMCHGQKDTDSPYVDGKAFASSIHGRHLCVSCHQDAKELPHAEKLSPVSCARCHRLESQIYRESDHGRAVAAGPTAATLTPTLLRDVYGVGARLLTDGAGGLAVVQFDHTLERNQS
jgi:hypothetical protein